jgi:hypothetical protein
LLKNYLENLISLLLAPKKILKKSHLQQIITMDQITLILLKLNVKFLQILLTAFINLPVDGADQAAAVF